MLEWEESVLPSTLPNFLICVWISRPVPALNHASRKERFCGTNKNFPLFSSIFIKTTIHITVFDFYLNWDLHFWVGVCLRYSYWKKCSSSREVELLYGLFKHSRLSNFLINLINHTSYIVRETFLLTLSFLKTIQNASSLMYQNYH